MKIIFSILVITLLNVFSLQASKIDLVLEYVRIDKEHNSDLNRDGLEFRDKVFKNIIEGNLIPFNKETNLPFIKDSLEKRIKIDSDYYSYYLYGRDCKLLVFERIKSKKNKSIIKAIHFYLNDYQKYLFSIRYIDFKKIIEKENYVILRNQTGPYWKNGLFLTHGDWMVNSYDYHKKLIQTVVNREVEVTQYGSESKVSNQDFLTLLDTSKSLYCCNFYNHSLSNRNVIGFEIYDNPKLWGKNKKYEFDFNEELLVEDKAKPVYRLEDYLDLGLYEVSKVVKIKPQKIDKKTSLKNESLIKSYKGKLICDFTEMVVTSYKGNTIFHDIYPNFMEELVNYSLASKISDSLTSHFKDLDEFKLGIIRTDVNLPQWNYFTDFKKGDTISYLYNRYLALEDIPKISEKQQWVDEDNWAESNWDNDSWGNTWVSKAFKYDSSKWKKLDVELYDLKEIEDLECNFKITFDEEGNNLNYKLESISIFISTIATGNTRGIQIPIATYDWDDIKKLFPNKRFIKAMEERDYFSYYLTSSIAKPIERIR